MERLGFIGIIIEDRSSAKAVNDILSSFGDIIRGRMGVPDHQTGDAVIGVVVKVKSALASPKSEKTKG